MKTNLYIRADGSTRIGLGHLIRSIAFGQMLSDAIKIHFVSKEIPEEIITEISEIGWSFLRIEHEPDFINILTASDLVLIDSYELDFHYQQTISEIGCKLICIDDLHDKPSCADLILNHTPGITPEVYDALPYTQFGLGPSFALLRPPFLNRSRSRETKLIESVLICFGGADSNNLTAAALNVVLKFLQFKQITVVTGVAFQHLQGIKEIAQTNDKIILCKGLNAEQMAHVLSENDLIIVPASGILTEALALGGDIISGMYVANQKEVFQNYAALDAFVSADHFSNESIENAIRYCLKNHKISKAPVIDGKSGTRISKLVDSLVNEQTLKLRRANINDSFITFSWANNKIIRANSFNKESITFEEHNAWFISKVTSQNTYYYLAEIDAIPAGSIRFDIRDGNAIVSYLLDPVFHNRGLGSILLKRGIKMLMNDVHIILTQITGYVLIENIASCKAFERLGFQKTLDSTNFKYFKVLI